MVLFMCRGAPEGRVVVRHVLFACLLVSAAACTEPSSGGVPANEQPRLQAGAPSPTSGGSHSDATARKKAVTIASSGGGGGGAGAGSASKAGSGGMGGAKAGAGGVKAA